MLEPRLLMTWLTLSLRPRTMDEIPMTTATPITMPSTVSDERILLLRIVSTAMFRPSPNSPLMCIRGQEPLTAEYAERAEKTTDPSLPRSLGMTNRNIVTFQSAKPLWDLVWRLGARDRLRRKYQRLPPPTLPLLLPKV